MIYDEKQFILDNPCQAGFDFADARKFDFVLCYKELTNPNWLLWLLVKTGNLDQAQADKIKATIQAKIETLPVKDSVASLRVPDTKADSESLFNDCARMKTLACSDVAAPNLQSVSDSQSVILCDMIRGIVPCPFE